MWSFNNFYFDDKNVLENDFESFVFDSSRDGLSDFTGNLNKKAIKLPTVQQVWQWLFKYPKKKVITTTTTEKTTTESYPISIGRIRRPPKYKRSCNDLISYNFIEYFEIFIYFTDSCQVPPKKHSTSII